MDLNPFRKQKLAPGSTLSLADQLQLYMEQFGEEKTLEQIRLARLEKGQCTCTPSAVKRRWDGNDKLTTRRVHAKDCPKRKSWMDENVAKDNQWTLQ